MSNFRIDNIHNVQSDTKELIIEMQFAMDSDYPLYNAAMLLFRPILVHILKDSGESNYNEMNYSEIILALNKKFLLPESLKECLFGLKNLVNTINHKCQIILDEDKALVEGAIVCVKDLVEIVYIF